MRLILVVLLAAGCEKKVVGPPVKVGEIGAATFIYGCGPDSDPQCNMDAELAPKAKSSVFPSIANGAKVAITAVQNAEAGTGAPLAVVTAGSAMIDVDPMSKLLVAKHAGWASLLAQNAGTTLDITSVRVADPKTLKILQAAPDGKFLGGSVQIGPGGVSASSSVQYTFRFRAVPLDDGGAILAGALPCQWTTSDANVAKLTSDPKSNIAVVVSGASGTANVDVTLGTLKGQIAIEVK